MRPMRFALDTNLLFYAFDADAGDRHGRAAAMLRSAANVGGCLTLQAANELFFALVRKGRFEPSDARELVASLMGEFDVVEPTRDCTLAAMRLCADHKIGFWDSLMLVVAAHGGCGMLLSEDLQDGRRFSHEDTGARTIVVVNPFSVANDPLLTACGLLSD